jgi:hypothetical protein
MMASSTPHGESGVWDTSADSPPVLRKIHELYHMLLEHNGFGELRMDVRILKRGQKEVIIHCGRQYRFVVDDPVAREGAKPNGPRQAGGGGASTKGGATKT